MRLGSALFLLGLLATGCVWAPVQMPPAVEATQLPNLVRIKTTEDSTFGVRAPTVRSDSLQGYFRFVTSGFFAKETGPLTPRAVPLTRVKAVTEYKVTAGSTLMFIGGAILGWCLSGGPGGC